MDQFIALIIIWAIIALLGHLSKKLKKTREETSPEAETLQPEPGRIEIPTIFREIFNLPEDKSQSPLPPDSTDEDEVLTGEIESGETIKYRIPLEKLQEPPPVADSVKEILTEFPQEAPLIQTRYVESGSLKKAVIWKEILDKPVSLRRLPGRHRLR